MEAKFKVYDYKTALDILKNACDQKRGGRDYIQ